MLERITRAVARLSKYGVDGGFLYVTRTGHEKGILDATAPVRDYLRRSRVHNFQVQKQGKKHKRLIPARLVFFNKQIETKISVYRPKTKQGDPRIWVYGLKRYIEPNQAICIVADRGKLFVLAASDQKLWNSAKRNGSPLGDLIKSIQRRRSVIAKELLTKIRSATAHPLRTVTAGSTGVGVTLERALGMAHNNKKTPDYKGIELKASRSNRLNPVRATFFGQVPEWDISALKGIDELLFIYGYFREGTHRLNCTVSAKKINSQGLFFSVEDKLLRERHARGSKLKDPKDVRKFDEVVTWKMETLIERLRTKHPETFWISATSTGSGSRETFTYRRIIHTRSPLKGALEALLDNGVITMDHLAQFLPNGAAYERGPLFKISKSKFNLIFPEPIEYKLQ